MVRTGARVTRYVGSGSRKVQGKGTAQWGGYQTGAQLSNWTGTGGVGQSAPYDWRTGTVPLSWTERYRSADGTVRVWTQSVQCCTLCQEPYITLIMFFLQCTHYACVFNGHMFHSIHSRATSVGLK